MRGTLLAAVVLLLVSLPSPAQSQEQSRLPGGGELVIEGFQFPPLDAAGKARVRELKGIGIAPSPLLTDTTVITELVNLVRQKTGLRVYTPADFTRAAAELGESVAFQAGLTEEEQNRLARRIGQKLGAGAVLVVQSVDRGTQVFVGLFGLNQGYVQSFTMRARLVAVEMEGIVWTQAMNYRLTWRMTALTVLTGAPAYANQTELALAVIRRMMDRFLSDAWNP